MKVLITAPSLDENRNVSGISTVVRQIIEYGTSEFAHFEAGRRDGNGSKMFWLIKQLVLPIRFLQRIRSFSPDVVHINTAMTGLAVCRDAVLVRTARFMGRPVVLAVHGGEYLRTPFKNGMIESIAGLMLRRAGSVVVLSENEREVMLSRWADVNIDVLPNAVPTDAVFARLAENETPVITFLGRMHSSKGLDEIIKACRILKDGGSEFVFKAYGDGPMRELFVSEMKSVLGDSFEYGGVVSGDEKWKALAGADIFILPSEFEGLSMALLEAMAAGCVVVASNIASISAVIKDGGNGYLVEPKNSRALTDVLRRLLTERHGWNSIRENASGTIRENYGIKQYVERLEKIYSDVVVSDK